MPTCSQCGAENPDGFRFCGACAAPLAEAPPAERRERRVVSVLFADLVGFTSRSEQLDVEEVEAFLHPYQALLRAEVERTGGVVAKSTGDGVMALFGGDVAHEDDPERAVRCGLGICQRLADEQAAESHSDTPLRVRVGVTTGEALVSHDAVGTLDAVGDVVNTAARLESAAPTDGVLVDEWTYRATDRVIRYESAESVSAKGKSEAVRVWRALEPRSVVPEQARASLPLVGRERERASLGDTFERSRHDPSTQLVSVIGEPGIGKTRLVDELYAVVEGLPELVTWRRGRSLSYGEGVAFWALGEIVKAQAGILESDSSQVSEAKLVEAVAAVVVDEEDRGWVKRHLRPLVGIETAVSQGEGGRVEAFAAWRRFFEALAEDGPTVLVFEDIHWADDALLDFIDLLADRAGTVPLLIVCTARPELLERREHWGGGMTNATTISLTPLSGTETSRLVAELLDQALLPAELQQALLERAEGNPLYAQEYVRMLQDRGLLVRRDGGWLLAGEAEGLPESIQGIIAARLDTLRPEEKSLIQDAAVIGKTGWAGAVCALTKRSAWETEELLHGLERKQLLQRVRRSSIQGEVEFEFGHALTRDVAYSQIRRGDRAAKHLAAAEWIEQLAGERDDKAELLADHYTQALALRQAIGEDTSTLAPKACAAYIEAGRQAAAVYANAAAARHLTAALVLMQPEDPARSRVLMERVIAAYQSGAVDEQTLIDALDTQVAAEDWEAAAEASLIYGEWLTVYEPDTTRAHQIEAQGAEYVSRSGSQRLAVRLATIRAFRLLNAGREADAVALLQPAIEEAERFGDPVGLARLKSVQGDALVGLGEIRGLEQMREAAATLARAGDQSSDMNAHNLSEVLFAVGDLHEAHRTRKSAEALAQRFGKALSTAAIQCGLAKSAYHSGDWNTASALTTLLSDDASQYIAGDARWTRGRILLARGDLSTPFAYATERLDAGVRAAHEEWLMEGFALRIITLIAAGKTREAAETCSQLFDRWRDVGGMAASSDALAEVATTGLEPDRVGEAAALLPAISRWKPALLATSDCRFAEAAIAFKELGSAPLEAASHLRAAEQAVEQGRSAQANHHARLALEFYTAVDATLHVTHAESLLAVSA